MLVKFTIEPDALSTARPSDIRNLLRSWWEPYGILVFPVKILRDSALKCKPAVKDLLQQSYRRFRSGGYPLWQELDHIDWDSMAKPTDLEDYHPKFELALIEETRALEFGFPPPLTRYFGDIEAAKLPDVSESSKFEAARQLANSNIPIGQPIDALWAERFQMLAKISKQVTIVDRYAAGNFDNGQQELRNLFRFLEKDSSKCYVTIYSSPGMKLADLDQIAIKLKNQISHLELKKIKKVTLHMSPDRVFSTYAHDRYIRFDRIRCVIGKGIEIFRYAETNAISIFAFKSSQLIQDSLRIERALQDEKTGTARLDFRNGGWQLIPTP